LNRFLLVALAVFVFSARGYVQVADTRYSLQTAERIVSSGQLDIAHAEGATLMSADGRSYSKYGLGLAFYYVPIVATARAVASAVGLPSTRLTEFLISLVNIPLALLALVAFARLQGLLGVPARTQLLVTSALALGTLFWRYAVHDFSEMAQVALLQVPGVLVSDHQIHHIKENLITPEERRSMHSDFVFAWDLLLHKMRGRQKLMMCAILVRWRRARLI
jgi:hypothetical protein